MKARKVQVYFCQSFNPQNINPSPHPSWSKHPISLNQKIKIQNNLNKSNEGTICPGEIQVKHYPPLPKNKKNTQDKIRVKLLNRSNNKANTTFSSKDSRIDTDISVMSVKTQNLTKYKKPIPNNFISLVKGCQSSQVTNSKISSHPPTPMIQTESLNISSLNHFDENSKIRCVSSQKATTNSSTTDNQSRVKHVKQTTDNKRFCQDHILKNSVLKETFQKCPNKKINDVIVLKEIQIKGIDNLFIPYRNSLEKSRITKYFRDFGKISLFANISPVLDLK